MKPTAYEVFLGPTNRVVMLKLIRYSLWMVLAPLSTFYFLFYVVFKQNRDKLGICGIAAVIAANVVIFFYVRMAWNEDRGDPAIASNKGRGAGRPGNDKQRTL